MLINESGERPLWRYWLAALVAVCGFLAWVERVEEPRLPARSNLQRMLPGAPVGSPGTVETSAALSGWPASNSVFEATSWFVAPPVIKAPPAQVFTPAPPPQPTPPPLPFQYLGELVLGDGGVQYQVLRGERPISLTKGMELEGGYQFEGAQGRSLIFTYLPMTARQSLAMPTEFE